MTTVFGFDVDISLEKYDAQQASLITVEAWMSLKITLHGYFIKQLWDTI